MMKLSIVILTHNQKDITLVCLQSLEELINRSDIEVIVVDNGSSDCTYEAIKSQYNRIILIRNTTNLGVAVGRNQGYRVAMGEYILQLDNDTIPSVHSIQAMLSYAETQSIIGVVTCKLLDSKGKQQRNCRVYPGVFEKIKNFMHLSDRSIQDIHYNSILKKKGSYIIGACQLFPKKILDRVGFLDEHIFYGPEDADFCIRVAATGGTLVYLPDVSIVHYYARVTNKRPYTRLALSHLKALLYFYNKHSRWI